MNTDIISEDILKKAIDKGFKCKSYETITIYDIMKWLREEKKLYVNPDLVLVKNGLNWDFTIIDLNTSDIVFESLAKYSSYEEASIIGIEYVLDKKLIKL